MIYKFIISLALLTAMSCDAGKVKTNISTEPEYPIVFHPSYDITLCFGIERLLHPFDGQKYGKIAASLKKHFHISRFYEPQPISDETLATVHDVYYVENISHDKALIERIAEVPGLSWLPNWTLQRNLINPIRLGTAGTIMAADLAMKYGWSINLSGGYHHAKAKRGEGFCFFADIPLAIKALRKQHPQLKVLIVDLDAHRGNGIESIIASDKLTYVFDMYSYPNYPNYPAFARNERVDFAYALQNGIQDAEYLDCLQKNLPKAIETVQPDIIFYNAGSDIYERDRLGRMSITREGIIARDLFVFGQAANLHIPICMTLSGGYSPESHAIVSESIKRIIEDCTSLKTSASSNPSSKISMSGL